MSILADKYTKNGTTKTWKETGTKTATDYSHSSQQDAINSWNSGIDAKVSAAQAAGKNVYVTTDAQGYKHYSTQSQDKANAIAGSYNTGGSTNYVMDGKNYTWQEEQKPSYSYDTGYDSHKNWLIDTLSQQERIKSYYDEYLPAMMEGGKAQADKSYEANANAALNNRTEALRQQKENYIKNVMGKRNQLETARASKDAQLGADVKDSIIDVIRSNIFPNLR